MLIIALGRLSQQGTYSRLIWAAETFKKRKLLSLGMVGDKLPRKERKKNLWESLGKQESFDLKGRERQLDIVSYHLGNQGHFFPVVYFFTQWCMLVLKG